MNVDPNEVEELAAELERDIGACHLSLEFGKGYDAALRDVVPRLRALLSRDCTDCERCLQTCDMSLSAPGSNVVECVNCDNCPQCPCPKQEASGDV